jgi:hypothetical protein
MLGHVKEMWFKGRYPWKLGEYVATQTVIRHYWPV